MQKTKTNHNWQLIRYTDFSEGTWSRFHFGWFPDSVFKGWTLAGSRNHFGCFRESAFRHTIIFSVTGVIPVRPQPVTRIARESWESWLGMNVGDHLCDESLKSREVCSLLWSRSSFCVFSKAFFDLFVVEVLYFVVVFCDIVGFDMTFSPNSSRMVF